MNLRDQNPRLESKRPWQSHEEFLVDVAIENALVAPEEQLRAMTPVGRPGNLFPERTGFRQEAWTIETVLNVDRYCPTNRSWMSGMPVRPAVITDQSWSGTARNAMSEGIS